MLAHALVEAFGRHVARVKHPRGFRRESAMKGMKEILSNCKTLVVEFLPHHLKNVADIDVDTFISALPGHFTNFQLPDNNQAHNISEVKTVLQKMYDSNIGEDGIIFTSN